MSISIPNTLSNGTTVDAPNLNANFDAISVAAVDLSSVQTISGVKTFSATPKTDAIAEVTGAAGVTVDGCLIKDGGVAGMRETTGPTVLTFGAVADGQYLKRSGATVIGAAALVAFSGARAYRSGSNQSVTGAAAATKLQLNSETYDVGAAFDSAVNYRYTPTVAGYYEGYAQTYWNMASGTLRRCMIYKNGVEAARGEELGSSSFAATARALDVFSMNGSTDYLEVFVYSDTTDAVVLGSHLTFAHFKLVGL
jgi:hypothetical protein